MDAVRAFVNRLYLEIFYEKKKVINFFDNIFLKKVSIKVVIKFS